MTATPVRIANRYALVELLGRGAHGEVWAAGDLHSGGQVAIKLLAADAPHPRARREVLVLRALRVPGVVHLLDEGIDRDRRYLVMELVRGTAFPGRERPCSWRDIEATLLELLQILGRIHGAGVIHRDLKPGNVLVDGTRPVVLDFGLSHLESPFFDRLTEAREVVGTPAYLAPEQITGDPITVRTDLYALGVMLYEALAGHLPHEASDFAALIRIRMSRAPRRIKDAAPDVPAAAAELIDELLAPNPDDRPASAAEVIRRLRGDRPPVEETFPLLGSRRILQSVVDAALAGRSVDLLGPAGGGKSRCLREAASGLAAAGRRVCFAMAARRPFASLEPVIGLLDTQVDRSLDEVTAWVAERVCAALHDGAVIVADDWSRLDPSSASTLARCRSEGAILRGLPEGSAPSPPAVAVQLAPLSPEDLASLFHGPDRIFHLREDAARILWSRTRGLPGRVVQEINSWIGASLARWVDHAVQVERDALDYLDAGFAVAYLASTGTASDPTSTLPTELIDLLGWIGLAGTKVDLPLLASAIGQPRWRVEAEVRMLADRGAAVLTPDGMVHARSLTPVVERWSVERRLAAHRALSRALPPGTPGRLFHMIASDEGSSADEIAQEASTTARALLDRGLIGHATAVVTEASRALNTRAAEPSAREGLFAVWAEVALADRVSKSVDRVLYELERARPATALLDRLEKLVRARLACDVWSERALLLADEVPAFEDVRLDLARQGVRLHAARRGPAQDHERVVRDVLDWAARHADDEVHAQVADWYGLACYRLGRFEEAARAQMRATQSSRRVTVQMAAALNAASALLELHRLPEAQAHAERARSLARACRHPFFEARAEWLLRCVAYRSGNAVAPDHELATAVQGLRFGTFEPLVYLGEAAIAFRGGDHDSARGLLDRIRRAAGLALEPNAGLLADAMAIALGIDASLDAVESVVRRAMDCPFAEISLQALALAMRDRRERPARPDIERMVERVPPEARSWRREVYSVEEAVALLGLPNLAGASIVGD